MANCYIHTERQASNTCSICGKGICRECSNWAAGELYLCPQCWQANAPGGYADAEQMRRKVATPLFGAWVSRALYYAIAALVIIIGVWYVYATFITPSVVAPSGLAQLGYIWSRYNLITSFSILMFIVVLISGQLMLRTGPRQSQPVAARSEVKTPTMTLGAKPVQTRSVIPQSEVQPRIQALRSRPQQSQPVIAQSEVQRPSQALRSRLEQSQPVIAPSEVQRPSQAKLVYCIYCGNRILASASVCDKCGKSQD